MNRDVNHDRCVSKFEIPVKKYMTPFIFLCLMSL